MKKTFLKVTVILLLFCINIKEVNASYTGCENDELIYEKVLKEVDSYGRVLGTRNKPNLIYDSTYGSLDLAPNYLDLYGMPNENSWPTTYQLGGIIKSTRDTLHKKYVIDEVNKTITIMMVFYTPAWRNSGGNWQPQLHPTNPRYTLDLNLWDASFIQKINSKVIPLERQYYSSKAMTIKQLIGDTEFTRSITSLSSPIFNIVNSTQIDNFVTEYSKNPFLGAIDKSKVEEIKTYFTPNVTVRTKPTIAAADLNTTFSLDLDVLLKSNYVNSTGSNENPATGMGKPLKHAGQYCQVIGSLYYIPFIMTFKYEDTPQREICKAEDALDINSPYFEDYWEKTGTESNPIYTPTLYGKICTCNQKAFSGDFIHPAFRTALYDENGGYYVSATDNKGTPNLKISCPTVETNICTLDNYNKGLLSEADLADCCLKGEPGFDDSICKAANDEFDLYCDTNLTETKTYKSLTDEIPGNDVCTIKCEEEGTLTFKESQFVIAGQKLNYDFDYNSKKVCKATYEMTPAQFQTNYNNIVTSRVAAYNDYLRAKKTYDDYVSAKRCEGSSNRTVYYTCSTGTLSGTSCLYKENYTVYGSSTDRYMCMASKTYGLVFTGATPSSVTCSDGTTSSPFSVTSSGSAPSGSCVMFSRVNVTNSYEATCTSNESDPATYNCDCKNTASLTCDAYDDAKAVLAATMNSKYTIYTDLLSDEASLINKKNACDNFVTKVESNADFEYEIEEKATSSFELRESEVKNSDNSIIRSTNNNINLMLNCGTTATSCSLAANGRSTLAYTNWDKLSESTFTYTYPDVMYIDRITGKAMSTAPNDYYYGGYNYYTDYSTLTGRYDIRVLSRGTFGNFEQWKLRNDEMTCWYNVDNRLGPPKADANYPEYGSNGIAFRVVKLSDLFPNNRESGTNWKSEETLINKIESKGDTIYTSEPKYKIVLTPSSMKQIRKYNAENPYNTWSDFKFEDGTTEGTSGFLEDMISKGIIKMEVTTPKEQDYNPYNY